MSMYGKKHYNKKKNKVEMVSLPAVVWCSSESMHVKAFESLMYWRNVNFFFVKNLGEMENSQRT